MWGWVALVVGALVVALPIGFVLGMRAKFRPLLTAIRRTNRVVFNPRQMKSAGAPGSSASVVRHRGRTSGRSYETPVQAVPTEDGYVVALPYGTQADWVKNVLAAGSATVVSVGQTHRVEHPEVVPMASVAGYFSPGDRRTHRMFGVDECLRVRRSTGES